MKSSALFLTALLGVISLIFPVHGTASKLVEVATSSRLWNGVAVSPKGRIFVSFPRWLEDDTISVGEILKDGSVQSFPNQDWNQWNVQRNPRERFVSVNAVFTDKQNNLWVVDTAAPRFGSVIPGGAKLVQIDLTTNQIKRVYPFNSQVAPKRSYINDVRIHNGYAYLTESSLGAIIVLNLQSGQARRLLANHWSTKSDPSIVPVIEGKEFRNLKGEVPQLHANDVELSVDGTWLYFQPTYGPNLLRIRTEDLRNTSLSEQSLGARVEVVTRSRTLGGMTIDSNGTFYLSDIEGQAIMQLCPNGSMKELVRDTRLQWPDAPSIGPDGYLYVPVAQMHRMAMFNKGVDRTEKPFRLFRVKTESKRCET